MSIVAGDIEIRLSGGSSNTDKDASIGGAKSSTVLSGNIFDTVSSAEALAGDTEYRCVYVHNAHATLSMLSPKAWVLSDTPASDSSIEFGWGAAAVNSNETAIADENTAPSGVTFSAGASEGASVALGADIPAGQAKALWFKRIINASAAAGASNPWSIRLKFDTL